MDPTQNSPLLFFLQQFCGIPLVSQHLQTTTIHSQLTQDWDAGPSTLIVVQVLLQLLPYLQRWLCHRVREIYDTIVLSADWAHKLASFQLEVSQVLQVQYILSTAATRSGSTPYLLISLYHLRFNLNQLPVRFLYA